MLWLVDSCHGFTGSLPTFLLGNLLLLLLIVLLVV